MYVLGGVVSSRIKKSYQGLIYKQETQEVQLVKRCLSKLTKENGLESILPFVSVCMIHNTNSIAMFLSPD